MMLKVGHMADSMASFKTRLPVFLAFLKMATLTRIQHVGERLFDI